MSAYVRKRNTHWQRFFAAVCFPPGLWAKRGGPQGPGPSRQSQSREALHPSLFSGNNPLATASLGARSGLAAALLGRAIAEDREGRRAASDPAR
jgi:hypothetical protein